MTGSQKWLGHRDLCSIQWSDYCDCEDAPPVLVTSEALMFAEQSIPWPDERPYEKTLGEDETHD